jgi:hypothetical protein
MPPSEYVQCGNPSCQIHIESFSTVLPLANISTASWILALSRPQNRPSPNPSLFQRIKQPLNLRLADPPNHLHKATRLVKPVKTLRHANNSARTFPPFSLEPPCHQLSSNSSSSVVGVRGECEQLPVFGMVVELVHEWSDAGFEVCLGQGVGS